MVSVAQNTGLCQTGRRPFANFKVLLKYTHFVPVRRHDLHFAARTQLLLSVGFRLNLNGCPRAPILKHRLLVELVVYHSDELYQNVECLVGSFRRGLRCMGRFLNLHFKRRAESHCASPQRALTFQTLVRRGVRSKTQAVSFVRHVLTAGRPGTPGLLESKSFGLTAGSLTSKSHCHRCTSACWAGCSSLRASCTIHGCGCRSSTDCSEN